MSEQFKSNIERLNKRLTLELGGHALFFEYANTTLYEHPEPYTPFDNITRVNEAGQYIGYLREEHPEVYETLKEEGFPTVRTPYPSLADEKMWLNHQDRLLEEDLEEFTERGELY